MIEIMTFRLGAGVDDDEFIAADARVQTGFSYQQAGLIRRTTARSADGRWLILQLWSGADAADDAARAFEASMVGEALMALVDADSVTIERFTGLA